MLLRADNSTWNGVDDWGTQKNPPLSPFFKGGSPAHLRGAAPPSDKARPEVAKEEVGRDLSISNARMVDYDHADSPIGAAFQAYA
jgi:hypothetical protein